MKRSHSLLLAVVVLLIFIGAPGWLVYRDVQQERLNRALIEAIRKRDTKAVSSALEQGANANAEDTLPDKRSAWIRLTGRLRSDFPPPEQLVPQSIPALMLACGFELPGNEKRLSPMQPEVIKALVRHGADVNFQGGWWGGPPLMIAVTRSDYDLIQMLLDYGADANAAQTGSRATALMCTAGAKDRVRKARLLLDHRADINAKDHQGNTVLHRAAFFGNTDMVKLLLERGANVNIKSKSGESPLKAARKFGNSAIAKLFQQAGAKE